MLAEAFASATRGTRQGLPCPVAAIMETLDSTDLAALETELEREIGDPARLSNAVLARTLNEAGYPMHPKGVERHRNRSCRCFSGRS